jgi:NAD(P)-dependent dehydrogenase (short-subunit alcohol dehydrogenase family)
MANSFEHISISAVKVLARLAAKRAVQAELRAAGIRVTLVKPAAINSRAMEYLASHPELYVAAHERAKRMIAEGVFGKRAQRELRERINEQNTQPAQHDLVRTA